MLSYIVLGVVTFTTLHYTIKGNSVKACYGDFFGWMVCGIGQSVNVTSAFYQKTSSLGCNCDYPCGSSCTSSICYVYMQLKNPSYYNNITTQCNVHPTSSCYLSFPAERFNSGCSGCGYTNYIQINYDCVDLPSTRSTTTPRTTHLTIVTTNVAGLGFTTNEATQPENSTAIFSSAGSLKTPSPMLQNIGIIAGVVCGISIAVIAAVIVTVLFFLHHRNRLKTPPPPSRESTANIYADPAIVERAYAEIGQLNGSIARKGIQNLPAFETNVIPDGAQTYDNAGFDGHVYYNSTTDPKRASNGQRQTLYPTETTATFNYELAKDFAPASDSGDVTLIDNTLYTPSTHISNSEMSNASPSTGNIPVYETAQDVVQCRLTNTAKDLTLVDNFLYS